MASPAASSAASAGDAADMRIHVTLRHLAMLEGQAKGFSFLPRQPVNSVLSGMRTSRLRGRGLEFEEIRAYLPGDDIRSIDWRVTARTGSPHVRVMREERDRPALIVVDQRQAMFFGSRLNMKSVTAAEAAALTAWRILAAKDRVGGLVFGDMGMDEIAPARSRGGLLRFLRLLADRNAALRADAPIVDTAPQMLNEALRQASRMVKHDWLIVVLSDFDGADDETFRNLRKMSQGNDIVLGLIHDPMAREFPARGEIVATNGQLQLRLDLRDRRVQQNLSATGDKRLDALLEWQSRLDLAILPLSAGEATLTQMLRLFGFGRSPRQASAPSRQAAEGGA